MRAELPHCLTEFNVMLFQGPRPIEVASDLCGIIHLIPFPLPFLAPWLLIKVDVFRAVVSSASSVCVCVCIEEGGLRACLMAGPR